MGVKIKKKMRKEGTEAYLWIDLVNLLIQRFKRYNTKSTWHSYKLSGSGRRFMFVRDGNRKVVNWWGGYSLKLYNRHFIQNYKKQINREFGQHPI